MPTFDQSVASRLAVGEVLGESSEGVAGPVDLSGAFASVGGADFDGSDPVAVDSVTAAALVTLPDTDVNGFVVKVAGNDTLYGRGQAFMVLEEGAGDATDQTSAGSVLFRIDGRGGVGATGALHVAAGLRKATGGTQAVWIDPSENIVGLVIHNPSVAEAATWNKDFVLVVDVRNSNDPVFRIDSTGIAKSTKQVVASDTGASRVQIGDYFTFAAVVFGETADTAIVRREAKVLSIANSAWEFEEMTAPAAPAANRARLFCQDNGSGKSRLCVRFPTGATQVLATEP